jgi:hypothetical protein
MAVTSVVVRFDAVRTMNWAVITNLYQALGSVCSHPMRLIKFVNNTDGDMYFSFDGTTNNDFVPAGGYAVYDLMTNALGTSPYTLENLTQFYVKFATAPSLGDVYVVAVYGKGD